MGVFALGVLVFAVLFADRVGSPEDLRRRFFQLGFAVVFALFFVSLPTVILPAPEDLPDGLGFGAEDDERVAHLLKERVTIIVGASVIALLAAMSRWKSMPVTALGVSLGSLVLLLGAVIDTSSSGFLLYYYDVLLDGGELRNGIYTLVSGLALALLFYYGFREWDGPGRSQESV